MTSWRNIKYEGGSVVNKYVPFSKKSKKEPIKAVGRSLNEILADLEQAEERSNKEGWVSADDAEKLLED